MTLTEEIDLLDSSPKITNPLDIFQQNFLDIIKDSWTICSIPFPKDILGKILVLYNNENHQFEVTIRMKGKREPFNRVQNRITEKIENNDKFWSIAIFKDDPFEVEFKINEVWVEEFKQFMQDMADSFSDFPQIKDINYDLTLDDLKKQLGLIKQDEWIKETKKITQERANSTLTRDISSFSEIFSSTDWNIDKAESLLLLMPEDEKLWLDDIILPNELREKIKNFIFDLKYKDELLKNGWRIKNILMQWPPGVGKTELARLIASQEWITVYMLWKNDYQISLAWEWQKNLLKILNSIKMRAEKNNEHAIIFMDEVEWIIKNRFNQHWGASRIDNDEASVLLRFLDWIRRNSNVTIIAATNAPLGEIDEAFLRSPRCEDIWVLNKPGKIQIKKALIVHIDRKNKFWIKKWISFFDFTQEQTDIFSELMTNFNYPDIEAVITNACNMRFRRIKWTGKTEPVSEMEIRSAINIQKKKINEIDR
ncbi:MAG: hypothetical protein ACD_3C00050G0001 [uncultured bacterium (gcode 4)]|uniref:AAA+ ATPase domain-containing protein n=1 Tax=uncultured bacterium (gcode 4) TaxID=1234023 RepID=K2FBL1_9BACT|nr:MAG: hypothetical protein ACD_3C00050G0001 [uncultured bacterium (gcode 4)]